MYTIMHIIISWTSRGCKRCKVDDLHRDEMAIGLVEYGTWIMDDGAHEWFCFAVNCTESCSDELSRVSVDFKVGQT